MLVHSSKNPIILKEQVNNFVSIACKDIWKVFNKVLSKYPNLKKLNLFFLMEDNDYDESEGYMNVISFSSDITDEDEWNRYRDSGFKGKLNSKSIYDDEDLQNQFNKFISEVSKEVTKLGYGTFEFDYIDDDGVFYLYDINNSKKMKELKK